MIRVMTNRSTTPHLTPIKNGWAAVGHGWAVFADSRAEALDRYQEAEQKHAELRARADSPIAQQPPSAQSLTAARD
jgi:hypothetical protein